MYLPKHFEESSVETLHDLMHAHPLATLVTFGQDGLSADHIPLNLFPGPTPYGTLRGHVARANPLWRKFSTLEILAIFHGPDAYVTPSWYPSKQETGKVAPTWNYAVAHAYGKLRVIDDPAWLRAQVEAMTTRQEAAFPHPWSVSDAPVEFTEQLLSAIVGIEINIDRLQGKAKLSQNRSAPDREGVVHGLEKCASPLATTMKRSENP